MAGSTNRVRARTAGLLVLSVSALGAWACQPGLVTGVGDVLDGQTASLDDVRLYVEDDSPAQRQAEQWRSTRPADASYMNRIANESQGIWFGDWTRDVRTAVASVMASSAAAGAVPVLVAYNIPNRDCGLHSAGGARDAASYRSWIGEFARGLRGGPAIVIVEPDAAAGLDCLSEAERSERLGLLREAIVELKGAGAFVYLDAGHAFWHPADRMATVLRSAGVADADGFALNVSNFHATGANVAYGQDLGRRLGGVRFVIDTSRNGLATARPDQWCNAPEQALGDRPRTNPGPALVDAFLWIKRPGESDGPCNGGPAAGQWWADYALGLAQRQPVALAAGP